MLAEHTEIEKLSVGLFLIRIVTATFWRGKISVEENKRRCRFQFCPLHKAPN
jgi:hypothetical protein